MLPLAVNLIFGVLVAGAAEVEKFSVEYAAKAVDLSIECVQTDSPHYYEKFGATSYEAKKRHPAFFGCFDWHSSVHGHWAMLRVLHRWPSLPQREKILEVLNRHLTEKNISDEISFFQKQTAFEFPYGYGWFFRLAQEVRQSNLPEAKKWSAAIRPFEIFLMESYTKRLSKMNRPMREGMHSNMAYSFIHALDYADSTGQNELGQAIRSKAKDWYLQDKNCPLAYEPSSGDFISPCFTEADLMRRVLDKKKFRIWLNGFMPRVPVGSLQPTLPLDSKDYILGHLVGLMFQKASALQGVASVLDSSDSRKHLFSSAGERSAQKGWQLMFDTGYGGTHWLASFAIYYFDNVGNKK